MKLRLFNIEWDTDGEDVDLPDEVIVNVDDDFDPEEDAADLLSERYDWCVEDLEFEVLDG